MNWEKINCFKNLKYIISVFGVIISGISCSDEIYTPKPKGWNFIYLPTPKYIQTPDSLPYFFKYSTEAKLVKDDSYFSEQYWIDLDYPSFDARIQVSYKPIEKKIERLIDFLGDSFTLTNKHQIKAYSIEEKIIKNKHNHTVVLESLEGEVPTPYQFFITDSVNNFFRAALYFKTATKNDSLALVIKYLKKDMDKMVSTFDWRNVKQKKYSNFADTMRSILKKNN